MTDLPAGRGARTAVAAVGLLVLVLVAVLVGLLGPSGSDGSGPDPAGTTSARPAGRATTAPSTRSSRRPTAPPTTTAGRDPQSGLPLVALGRLPAEAQQTVALIDRGGPFPYAKDGVTFGNNEHLLPAHARGWYREYTVRTPGEGDRGPRRIVTGDDDREIFYTGDHYVTFVRVTR